MLLKLSEPKVFADAIAILSELVTEVNAKVTKEGIEITAVDPANVSLVNLKLNAGSFSQINVDEEETLGLNLEDLKQVLRRVPIGGILTLEKDGNLLKLTIQEKVKRVFALALINLDLEEKKVPDLTFNNKIEMSSNEFSETITDCSIVADACTFEIKEGKFIIKAKGSLNKSKTEFGAEEAKLNVKEGKSRYSLEYLNKFIKTSRISPLVKINFSSNYPAKIEFADKDKKIELNFILAPRVEED